MASFPNWLDGDIGDDISLSVVGERTETYRFVVRLYVDRFPLKQTLRQWGILAPVVFVALQALQVIIAPIPGDVTGILGGYLFGEWLGWGRLIEL